MTEGGNLMSKMAAAGATQGVLVGVRMEHGLAGDMGESNSDQLCCGGPSMQFKVSKEWWRCPQDELGLMQDQSFCGVWLVSHPDHQPGSGPVASVVPSCDSSRCVTGDDLHRANPGQVHGVHRAPAL